MGGIRFGLRIPSYAWPDLTYEEAGQLAEYCRRVEAGPFEDIWVIDHLLVSEALYGVTWIDSMTMLAFAAGVTERVGLGTAALVLPLRHPVILAKEIASLHLLSGGRFLFGVAIGWEQAEFAATGVPLRERGRRTDEALDLIYRLLTEREVTFEGRYFRTEGLTIYPRVSKPPPLWVAGGSLGHAPETPDKPYIAPGVLARLARADGWMSRSSGSDPSSVKADWVTVQRFLEEKGRDPDSLVFGHTQFLHLVETGSREEAIDRQMPMFQRVMGTHRSRQDLETSYLMGTIDEIRAEVAGLAEAGLEYLILTPVSNDPSQLDLLAKHLVEPFGKQ